MDPIKRFEAVCAAMNDPRWYPHPVSKIERRDTHISAVFLTGQWAYKLKKPLNLGFLDFREPIDRKKFCEREVFLNRRLSQGIYFDTVEITEDEKKGFSLEGSGTVVEYAVRMKQIPDRYRLSSLLRENALHPSDLEELGGRLAIFYEKSDRNDTIDAFGRRDVMIFNSEENFQQIDPYAERLLDTERWKFVREVNRSFLYHRRAIFERRIEEGKIRDGHGDLRTDHIYFFDGIQIIDCIEFNDRFRYGDIAADLAFLHMDMEELGFPEQSQEILKGYLDRSRDFDLYGIVDFYAAYRAIVRLKVACIRYDEEENEARRRTIKAEIDAHLDQAYRYTVFFSRPTLWVFCGLPASGKSSLAQRLSHILSIGLIGSDALRKQMDMKPKVTSYGKGAYSEKNRGRVYARMLTLAQEKLKNGHSVILDATYSTRKSRQEVVALASDTESNLIFVQCVCSRKTISSRLEERNEAPGLSDARITHLDDFFLHYEPLTELNPDTHITVDTDRELNATLGRLLMSSYLRRSTQIGRLIGME